MKRKSSDLTVEFKRAAVALMAPGVKISALALSHNRGAVQPLARGTAGQRPKTVVLARFSLSQPGGTANLLGQPRPTRGQPTAFPA
jgi:hypothetical protein